LLKVSDGFAATQIALRTTQSAYEVDQNLTFNIYRRSILWKSTRDCD